jgi:hypothetical protein
VSATRSRIIRDWYVVCMNVSKQKAAILNTCALLESSYRLIRNEMVPISIFSFASPKARKTVILHVYKYLKLNNNLLITQQCVYIASMLYMTYGLIKRVTLTPKLDFK